MGGKYDKEYWQKVLPEFASLGDNWDGYGALPIDPRCITVALILLEAFNENRLPFFAPINDGGIDISWEGQDESFKELSFSIRPDDWNNGWYFVDEEQEDK